MNETPETMNDGTSNAGEPAVGLHARVMPLVWTEPAPPDKSCGYHHCEAPTPFGRFFITWKGWKEWPSYSVEETPWGEWGASADTLEEAQAWAAAEFERRVLAALQAA